MKLNPNALALSLGLISALLFAVCAILTALWPVAITSFFSWWFHYDLTTLTRNVTLFSFVGGIILTFLTHYIFGWLFAWLYNKFAEKVTPTT